MSQHAGRMTGAFSLRNQTLHVLTPANKCYRDLDEAAARQTLPRVRMSADGEGERVQS
jgi:hypothetical protein